LSRKDPKKKMSKPITVYWSPDTFDTNTPYDVNDFNDPVPLAKYSFHSQINDSYFWQCPSIRDVTRNTFAFTSKYDEYTTLDPAELQKIHDDNNLTRKGIEPPVVKTTLKMPVIAARMNSLDNHVNFNYGRSWSFFADEPLEAKFTAPWLPPTAPYPGTIMAPGTFDIGRWFRPFHIEYFVPTTATSFEFKENEAFFYLEFLTDRKIIFKRFDIRDSKTLLGISTECVLTGVHFDQPYGLPKRYKMFKNKGYRQTILEELANITK